MRKRLLLLIAVVVCVATAVVVRMCFHKEAHVPTQAELDSIARRDSMALHVAVVANADCLPLYYAHERGMLEGDIRLLSYESRIDADTAITRGHCEVAYVDAARALLLCQRDSVRLRLFASLPTRLTLVEYKKKRAKKLAQMKDYIMGMERHAAADYYARALRDSAGLKDTELFFAQINDLRLRYKMVSGGQIETALLEEPYTTLALKQGHAALWHSPKGGAQLAAFALVDTTRQAQTQLLAKGYARALDELAHQPDPEVLTTILRRDYGLTNEEIVVALKVKPTPWQSVDTRALRLMRDFMGYKNIPVESLTTSAIRL